MIERRFVTQSAAPATVTRKEGGKSVIGGYAAVFFQPHDEGTQYQLFEDAVERIKPTAFDRALAEKHDCRCLFNHSSDALLGRTASGTLRLWVDAVGLRYEVDVDESDFDHDRILTKMRRGDLTGSSFAFRALKTTWEDQAGGPSIRWVEDLMLYDCGPVVFPAYESATSGIINQHERDAIKRERQVARFQRLLATEGDALADRWANKPDKFAHLRRDPSDDAATLRRKLTMFKHLTS